MSLPASRRSYPHGRGRRRSCSPSSSPTAVKLLERHLGTAKEWFPHELVPWSRGRDFAEGEALGSRRRRSCATGARSALFLNILTEDNLPHYYRQINGTFGNDDVWGEWNRRWTAEEGRHAIVIRDYLAVTRSIDLRELERARMRQVSMRHRARTPTPSPTASSTSRCRSSPPASRTATPASCSTIPQGEAIMSRVAADENLHHLFYRDLVVGRARDRPVGHGRGDRAPGAHVRDARRRASTTSRRTRASIADAGVYDFASHHDQILVPVVFKHWRIEQLQNLKAAAEQARERLVKHVEQGRQRRQAHEVAPGAAPRPRGLDAQRAVALAERVPFELHEPALDDPVVGPRHRRPRDDRERAQERRPQLELPTPAAPRCPSAVGCSSRRAGPLRSPSTVVTRRCVGLGVVDVHRAAQLVRQRRLDDDRARLRRSRARVTVAVDGRTSRSHGHHSR